MKKAFSILNNIFLLIFYLLKLLKSFFIFLNFIILFDVLLFSLHIFQLPTLIPAFAAFPPYLTPAFPAAFSPLPMALAALGPYSLPYLAPAASAFPPYFAPAFPAAASPLPSTFPALPRMEAIPSSSFDKIKVCLNNIYINYTINELFR